MMTQNAPAPSDWPPQNPLEQALLGTKTQKVPVDMFLQALVVSTLYVPSREEVQPDGSHFSPLLFERDGVPLVAAFTHLDRAGRYSDKAPFAVSLNGRQFLSSLPTGYGLVLNPGYDVRSEILPQGISAILRDFDAPSED
jgi:hypothetical protein